jgi:hypothetical protein
MDRRKAGWAAVGGAILLLLAPWSGAPARAAEQREVLIHGTVTDQEGKPLADYPVRLLKTKTILNLLHFSTGSQQQEEARIQTDASGNFELKIVPDPKYDYFYLRFYDAKTFDPVRYAVPGDRDITRLVKTRGEVRIDQVIQDNPDWSRVQGMLTEFGESSNRGRILRSLGLPERRETVPGSPGRENWWYYAKGICYQLQGDEVLKTRHFDPVLPPRPAT